MTAGVTGEIYVYGKLVQHACGPIVPGEDHRCTGHSHAFPASLVPWCHPRQFGIGTDDLFSWGEYPWLGRGGGLRVGRVETGDGQAWVLAVRVRGRSEAGDGLPGRFYTQATYCAVPADEWRVELLPALAEALRADPLIAGAAGPAPISLRAHPSAPLPAGWLEEVAPLLEVVMSGHPISVQEWELPTEAFIARAGRCLAAVPALLARRIAVGAGLANMDGSVALAHGQYAIGGLRVIGGRRRNEDAFDLSAGRRYVRWLREHAADCESCEALAERVARQWPELSGAQLSAGGEWTEIAATVGERLLEEDLLQRLHDWVRSGEGPPPALAFRFYREEALTTLLAAPWPLIARVGPELLAAPWQAQWQALTPEERSRALESAAGLAPLFRVQEGSTLRRLVPALADIPPPLVALFGAELTRLLALSHDPGEWLELVRLGDRLAWVREWCAQQRNALVWLALAGAGEGAGGALLRTLPVHELYEAALTLLEGGPLAATQATALLAALDPAQAAALERLLDWLWQSRGSAAAICALAEAARQSGLTSRWGERLTSPAQWPEFAEFVARLAAQWRTGSPAGSQLACRALLVGWSLLEPTLRGEIAPRLALAIGQPAAALLLDSRERGRGCEAPCGATAEAFLEELLGARPELADRLWQRLLAQPSRREVELLLRWCTAPALRHVAQTVAVRFLACLNHPDEPLPALEPPEVSPPMEVYERQQLAAAIATGEQLIRSLVTKARLPEHWQLVDRLLPQGAGAPPLAAGQLAEMLEAAAGGGRWPVLESLLNRRGEGRWREAPGWRLLARLTAAPSRLVRPGLLFVDGAEEVQALARLSASALLTLMLTGLRVPPSVVAGRRPGWDVELEREARARLDPARFDACLQLAQPDDGFMGQVRRLLAWPQGRGEDLDGILAMVLKRRAGGARDRGA